MGGLLGSSSPGSLGTHSPGTPGLDGPSPVAEQKQTGVVYEIPCKDCPEVYVGETKRTLKVRLSEHKQAVKRGDPKNGIAVHAHKTNHCINWDGATVQRRAEGFWQRRTVEAIQIKKATPNMNLGSGLLLPMVWNPILKPPPHPPPLHPILS